MIDKLLLMDNGEDEEDDDPNESLRNDGKPDNLTKNNNNNNYMQKRQNSDQQIGSYSDTRGKKVQEGMSRLKSEQETALVAKRGAITRHMRQNSEKSDENQQINFDGLDEDCGDNTEGQNPFSKNKGRRPQKMADEEDGGDD